MPSEIDYKVWLSADGKVGAAYKDYTKKDVSLTITDDKGNEVLNRRFTLEAGDLAWDCPILAKSFFKIRFLSDLASDGINEQAVILTIWFERDKSGKWHEELIKHGLPADYVGDSATGVAYESIALSEAAGGEPDLLEPSSSPANIDVFKRFAAKYNIPTSKADPFVFPLEKSIDDYNSIIYAYYIGKRGIKATEWMNGQK
jgi:hypothetical protein